MTDTAGWAVSHTVQLVELLLGEGVDLIDCSSGGPTTGSLDAQRPGYGYQVPLARQVKEHTGALTMAVGFIVYAKQADQIIRTGSADLVALGREMLMNPNWPLNAALKLSGGQYPDWFDPITTYWLQKRAASMPDFRSSTTADGETTKESPLV